MAERGGFEPPEAYTSAVFKTAALNHSTISPDHAVKLGNITRKLEKSSSLLGKICFLTEMSIF